MLYEVKKYTRTDHKINCLNSLALGVLRAKDILSHLLWAVRFERLPEVRAEACNAIALLGIRNDKVASALKDILIVEDNSLVLKYVTQCIINYGNTLSTSL